MKRADIIELELASSPNLGRAKSYKPLPDNRVEESAPELPSYLTTEEKKIWRQIVDILAERGTLTTGDGPAIARYATLESRRRTEQALLASEGAMIDRIAGATRHHAGTIVQVLNPRLKVVQNCERSLLALDCELGLTPKHRGKAGRTKKPIDAVAELMAGIEVIQ